MNALGPPWAPLCLAGLLIFAASGAVLESCNHSLSPRPVFFPSRCPSTVLSSKTSSHGEPDNGPFRHLLSNAGVSAGLLVLQSRWHSEKPERGGRTRRRARGRKRALLLRGASLGSHDDHWTECQSGWSRLRLWCGWWLWGWLTTSCCWSHPHCQGAFLPSSHMLLPVFALHLPAHAMCSVHDYDTLAPPTLNSCFLGLAWAHSVSAVFREWHNQRFLWIGNLLFMLSSGMQVLLGFTLYAKSLHICCPCVACSNGNILSICCYSNKENEWKYKVILN